MTLRETQEKLAREFKEIMEENEFDTFEEMKECYWWTTADIKEEVSAMLRSYESEWYVDGVDGTCVLNDIEMVSYRSFINGVYKIIKSL